MKRFHFDFADSGLFTLVNSEGESIYQKALPFFEKAMSHLAWITLWLVLLFVSHLFFSKPAIDYTLITLIFIHLFFFGCRLTTLLLTGGLLPILFPPLWIRLTRQLQKGKGLALLQKHGLETHPGLLHNLALCQYLRKETKSAQTTLQLALTHSPNHPTLENLLTHISRDTNL